MKKKRGLGTGISALIEDFNTSAEHNILFIDRENIFPNPKQPRKEFDEDALHDLAYSIKTKGIIQPLLVQKTDEGSYQIIAGERRWRAAGVAKLEKIPVVVKDVNEVEAYELALIENIQRQDLNPVEEAMGYRELIDEFELTQEELSKRLGKNRSTIANSLRILMLPEVIIEDIRTGRLTQGHAKVILSLKQGEEQLRLREQILSGSLSVVKAEKVKKKIASTTKQRKKRKTKKEEQDIYLIDVEESLKEYLSTKVLIEKKKRGGVINISFTSDDDLNRLVEKIMGDKEV